MVIGKDLYRILYVIYICYSGSRGWILKVRMVVYGVFRKSNKRVVVEYEIRGRIGFWVSDERLDIFWLLMFEGYI